MFSVEPLKKHYKKSRESVHVAFAFGFGQDIQRKGYGLTCVSVLLQRIVGHGESMMTNDNDWLPVVLPEV